jgi:hypothetical protein
MSLLNFFKTAETVPEKVVRENIQAQSGKIRLSDTDLNEGLDLFCYNHCDNNETDLVKNCRGIIFNEEKVVMRGFPYTEEYTTTDDSFVAFKNNIGDKFKSCRFYDAHEGALLRVFNWNNKWYITTHRKLDAFRSKWASKDSFGQMFKSALEAKWISRDESFMFQCYGSDWKNNVENVMPDILSKFTDSLDVTKQYMFLILNNYDNRIVCLSPEKPAVYHVGTFGTVLDGNVRIPNDICDHDIRVGIDWPREHTFENWENLVSEVNNQNPEKLQGIIIYDTKSIKQYKVFNREYYKLFQVRGNEPSVKYRYLQVRMDKQMVDNLYYLYPKFADAFDDYENTLYECAKQINKNYIDRFIKKKYVTVPKEEFTIMKACHDWHLEDREKNRISLRKVIDTMNEQNPSNLNKIIRRYKSEQVKDELSKHAKMTRLRARSLSHHSEDLHGHSNGHSNGTRVVVEKAGVQSKLVSENIITAV